MCSKVESIIDRYTLVHTFSINKALFSILASQQEQYCILKPSEAHKSWMWSVWSTTRVLYEKSKHKFFSSLGFSGPYLGWSPTVFEFPAKMSKSYWKSLFYQSKYLNFFLKFSASFLFLSQVNYDVGNSNLVGMSLLF